MKNKNVIGWVIIALVIVGGFYFFSGTKTASLPSEDVVVSTSTSPSVTETTNTKPAVTTTPIKTEVVAPKILPSGTLKINQRKFIGDVFVTPIHVTIDSRCPSDVKCIQAGTLDVNTLVQKGNLSQNVILSLNKVVVFSGKQIMLTAVTPKRLSATTIAETEYDFTITVK